MPRGGREELASLSDAFGKTFMLTTAQPGRGEAGADRRPGEAREGRRGSLDFPRVVVGGGSAVGAFEGGGGTDNESAALPLRCLLAREVRLFRGAAAALEEAGESRAGVVLVMWEQRKAKRVQRRERVVFYFLIRKRRARTAANKNTKIKRKLTS